MKVTVKARREVHLNERGAVGYIPLSDTMVTSELGL